MGKFCHVFQQKIIQTPRVGNTDRYCYITKHYLKVQCPQKLFFHLSTSEIVWANFRVHISWRREILDPGSKNYFWGQKNLCNTLLALALGSGHLTEAVWYLLLINHSERSTPICSRLNFTHCYHSAVLTYNDALFLTWKWIYFFLPNTIWHCNKIRKRSNDGEWITAKYKLSKKGEGKKQKPPFLQPIVSQQTCLSDFV